jgi:hypothetical protein
MVRGIIVPFLEADPLTQLDLNNLKHTMISKQITANGMVFY